MAFTLDHVVIAVDHLESAMADYEALGFTVIYGGRHASGTTHNALICFKDGTYLELLAPTYEPPQSGSSAMDFSFLLQYGEGLVAYALQSDNLEADAERLLAWSFDVSPVRFGGRKRADGVELAWKTALIDGRMSPFLLEDVTPRSLRVPDDETTTTHANGAQGIAGVRIMTADLTPEVVQRYARLLDTPPKYTEEIQPIPFRLGQTILSLLGVTAGQQDMDSLKAAHSDFLDYLQNFRDRLGDNPRFDLSQMQQDLDSAYDNAAESIYSQHDVGLEMFEKMGGYDLPVGIELRLSSISEKPFDLEKTHQVIFIDQRDLSVADDED
jgi:hypothetical protein